jgi:hypothetical protein
VSPESSRGGLLSIFTASGVNHRSKRSADLDYQEKGTIWI